MIRNTKQRQLILELFRSIRGHPTADEIYEAARIKNPRISKGTVYRNLGLLVDEGTLRGYRFAKDPERYDAILVEHSHFLCKRCHKLTDLPLGIVDVPKILLPQIPGYKVESHTLVINGLCLECAAQD
ncbi:MAG TPA: transcriptional repressor [Anaerolineaceae bacterium]|nr:transcriptional repressor [Anaerolineaceae bacterium]